MHDADRVGGGEAGKHLASDLGHASLGHRAVTELVRQGGARQVFHHEVVDAVLVARVMDRHHVRVRQAGRSARLQLEAVAQFRVGRAFAPEHLHRDGPPEAQIGGAVDHSMGALTEPAFQTVTAGEKAMGLLNAHTPLLARSAIRCNGPARAAARLWRGRYGGD